MPDQLSPAAYQGCIKQINDIVGVVMLLCSAIIRVNDYSLISNIDATRGMIERC